MFSKRAFVKACICRFMLFARNILFFPCKGDMLYLMLYCIYYLFRNDTVEIVEQRNTWRLLTFIFSFHWYKNWCATKCYGWHTVKYVQVNKALYLFLVFSCISADSIFKCNNLDLHITQVKCYSSDIRQLNFCRRDPFYQKNNTASRYLMRSALHVITKFVENSSCIYQQR